MTKKMTTKVVAMLLTVMLLMTFVAVEAYATPYVPEHGNRDFCATLEDSSSSLYRRLEQEIVKQIVRTANWQIDCEVAMTRSIANEQNIDYLLVRLVARSNAIGARAIRQAALFGAVVECEYEEVEILGRTVLIDPLRVISFRR